MSQKLIFDILKDFNNEVDLKEIKKEVEKQYPDRSLNQYISKRLKSLEKKGLIIKNEEGDKITWEVCEDAPSLSSKKIDDIDSKVGEKKLADYGIVVSNIVAVLDLGIEIDPREVDRLLSNTTYEPEMMTPLIIDQTTDREATFLLYSTGRVTVLGVDSKTELQENIVELFDELTNIGYSPDSSTSDVTIKNIHAVGELNQEIDLDEMSVYLGLENVEYNPAKFSGLTYRLKGSFIALFRTGKFTITGVESYSEVFDTTRHFINKLPSGITIINKDSR